jgi:hypothetical protein
MIIPFALVLSPAKADTAASKHTAITLATIVFRLLFIQFLSLSCFRNFIFAVLASTCQSSSSLVMFWAVHYAMPDEVPDSA